MLWWQHLFALWVLAHMLWASILLQREWRRMYRSDGRSLQNAHVARLAEIADADRDLPEIKSPMRNAG